MPTDVLGCWLLLADYLVQHNAMPKRLKLPQPGYEPDIATNAAGVTAAIREKNMTSFEVHTGYTEDRVAYTLQHDCFSCGILGNVDAPYEWSDLIETVMSRYQAIGGWQPFWSYHAWQDLKDLSSFQIGEWGDFPPGYRVWHEPDKYGIGPGQTLFDNSKNPGQTKVVDGRCVFYPTAEMWLGPHFWPYAKCTKDEALAADFWLETRDTPHYLYLKCWPEPFTRPDGEQGRMQQRLWKFFFHEDCEWPPGSGTICDEPMYGPPELMPD